MKHKINPLEYKKAKAELAEDILKNPPTPKERVQNERRQIAERIINLASYLGSDDCFPTWRHPALCFKQLRAMTDYLESLDERLMDWHD
jgi:hypothetical protein